MMEVVEFFFCDFLHFIMLLFVCWVLSPKIDIKTNSPTKIGKMFQIDEDKEE